MRRARTRNALCRAAAAAIALVCSTTAFSVSESEQSVARLWNEQLLDAIRRDFAHPTVHARNLYHTSVAMYDAWAAFDPVALGVISNEPHIEAGDPQAAQEEAISYAAYRLIKSRFSNSPGASITLPAIDTLMAQLGYDPNVTTLQGNHPAAVGNRCAVQVIAFGLQDGSNQQNNYAAPNYAPVNPPLVVDDPGTSGIVDPNRWQPLSLAVFIDQFGNPLPWDQQVFLTPHWGHVKTFGLKPGDMHPDKPGVYLDPGVPPQLGGAEHEIYREAFIDVLILSSMLDPDIDEWLDISPASLGNNSLGKNDGQGYEVNPITGEPYEPHIVRRGDFMRVLSEFWADGPGTEAPPGHWNVVANDVSYHPLFERRIGGTGPVLSPLEWDIKMYLALNGAVHDAGVACWGTKGYYDYVRPISAIRYMAELGQSSDPLLPSYHPDGLPLVPGVIELITAETTAAGGIHAHLAQHIGEVAVLAWPGSPPDMEKEYSGVKWIRAKKWVPYQLPTFVSPPFAGYTSGHSTFSRAAAEVLALMTGSEYFPGGLGVYTIEPGWLHNEFGPSEMVQLQWARYYDASDQSAISRIYGGIHPWIDDFPARIMGSEVGQRAWHQAQVYFNEPVSVFGDLNGDGLINIFDLLILLGAWGECIDCAPDECPADLNADCTVNVFDLLILLGAWS